MILDNPDLFSYRNARVLGANFQNTNTIEGVFALYRRVAGCNMFLFPPKWGVTGIAIFSDYITIPCPPSRDPINMNRL